MKSAFSHNGFGVGCKDLSIMIPNYNGARYIHETLQSLQAQSDFIQEAQIEVLDNQSTDDSVEIVRSLWGDRVRIHRNPANLGPTGNFNACIDRAERKWIHILHSDDVMMHYGYSEFDRTITQFPNASIVFARSINIDEQNNWNYHSTLFGPGERGQLEYNPLLWRYNIAQYLGTIFTREAADKVGRFDDTIPYCADWNYWWRLARDYKAVYSNHFVGLYRVHSSSGTSALKKSAKDIQDTLNQVSRLLSSPSSANLRNQTGDDYFYIPSYEVFKNRCFEALGDKEFFENSFKAMSGFPQSLFTPKLQRRLRVINMRHSLRLKKRLRLLK